MFWIAPRPTETDLIQKHRTLWIWHGLIEWPTVNLLLWENLLGGLDIIFETRMVIITSRLIAAVVMHFVIRD